MTHLEEVLSPGLEPSYCVLLQLNPGVSVNGTPLCIFLISDQTVKSYCLPEVKLASLESFSQTFELAFED